jgi:hypothetical protein
MQLPQCVVVLSATQGVPGPPHCEVPFGQPQSPVKHWSPLQTLRHMPQFCSSVCKSAHLLPHSVVPGSEEQSSTHAPPIQTWPVAHVLPAPVHAPQCFSSVCRSTQALTASHQVRFGGHWHMLPEQI